MTNRANDPATVLLVESDSALRELYEHWLSDRFDVRLAQNGADAEHHLEDEIDILILNRILPDLSEREIFEHVSDQEIECGVIMLTTQPPDFDILDMPFDEYLVKPVDRFSLYEAVARTQRKLSFDRCLRGYRRLITKRDLIESVISAGTLSNSERFAELLDRIAEVEACEDCCLGNGTDFISNGGIDH